MKNPLISIIIPTYNRASLIGETLQSILVQTYTNWECIIVDDGSTDNSELIIKEFVNRDNRFKYVARPNNLVKGANSCRNFGFELSKGIYVNWFDSDDLMANNMLELKMKAIQDNDYVLCEGVFFKEDNKNNQWGLGLDIKFDILSSYISNEISFNPPLSLWKRDILMNYKFDTTLSRAQELDFFSRVLFDNDFKGTLIKEKLVLIREHTDSITGNYNKGSKKQLIDDLKVRYSIFMRSQKKSNIITQNKTFGLFLKSLKIVIKNGYNTIALKYLIHSFLGSNNEKKIVLLKLNLFQLAYMISGKGYDKISKTINNLHI